ncbi:MAG TPA: alpha/beta hydrolase [Anaerolineae bacterium]|nr:alpha/beta hydrolase [Anaerolineae bacterium]
MDTQYMNHEQGKLAYTDYGGQGELVLMLPGMGALRQEYRYLGPALVEAGYHAVAVDLRGQGDSTVGWDAYDVPAVGGDILALIAHFGGQPAHLIGTSFSPASMVWASAEAPQLVKSLTLIGAFVRDPQLNPVMRGVMWLVMNNPWRVQMWKLFYPTMYPQQKPADFDAYMAELTRNLKEKGRFEAVRAFGSTSREPSESRLAQVQAPTLVVMGTADPDFPDPVAEANYIVAQTKGRLALIEGAGHYPQTEMPDKTTPAILDFLESV